MKRSLLIVASVLWLWLISFVPAQETKIYWASEVPAEWNGRWPEKFQTPAEKSNYSRTASNNEILEFFAALKWNSENIYIYDMFVSELGRNCPVVVMANPRVTSAKEAKESGKTIVYLQGGIHPSECEGKEALLMLMRDILFGERKYLLDKLIIMCCPNFNVDGNESLSVQGELPRLAGIRQNALGLDINRDAIKLETTNMQGACRNVFNNWDPTIILDTHLMQRTRSGYANAYATSNVPAAHPGPRDYVTDKLFPALRQATREKDGIEIFFHACIDDNWPPTEFAHDRGIWTVEGKFMVSGYGLRNRMSVLAETPGFESFEKRIYCQYVFACELLEYAYIHGEEMREVCRKADEDVVNKILAQAHTGQLKNFVDGKYESRGKFDIYAYKKLNTDYMPGTSIQQAVLSGPNEVPVLCHDVELLTKPVGTIEAAVPRGYLIPADMKFVVEKLRLHNIKVDVLDKPVKAAGEEFVIDKIEFIQKSFFNMTKVQDGNSQSQQRGYPADTFQGGSYNITKLQGGFFQSQQREFPAGTFRVDMAQPNANLAFYCLEPQVGDGFVGWGLLNDYLLSLGVKEHSVIYPVYKYFKIIE